MSYPVIDCIVWVYCIASQCMSLLVMLVSRTVSGCRLGQRPHGVATDTLCVRAMATWLRVSNKFQASCRSVHVIIIICGICMNGGPVEMEVHM